MKRIPLAVILGFLCFAALSIFSQHRTAAMRAVGQQKRQQDQQPSQPSPDTQVARPERSIINEDAKISPAPDGKADQVAFVPGEVLVKFKNEKDANDTALGRRTTSGTLKISNPRLNNIFARFGVADARKPFTRGKLKFLSRVVKLTTGSDKQNPNS